MSILQFVIERHDAAIYLGAACTVSEISMQGLGKIDRGCAFGQINYFALWRQHVDLVVK